MFRVIIAGTRSFHDYNMLRDYCDFMLSRKAGKEEIVVLSGGATGADALGERYAFERGYALEPHPAKWNFYGAKAGYIRNIEMAENADALIAFWDGKSSGTKHMIAKAKSRNLKVAVKKYVKIGNTT